MDAAPGRGWPARLAPGARTSGGARRGRGPRRRRGRKSTSTSTTWRDDPGVRLRLPRAARPGRGWCCSRTGTFTASSTPRPRAGARSRLPARGAPRARRDRALHRPAGPGGTRGRARAPAAAERRACSTPRWLAIAARRAPGPRRVALLGDRSVVRLALDDPTAPPAIAVAAPGARPRGPAASRGPRARPRAGARPATARPRPRARGRAAARSPASSASPSSRRARARASLFAAAAALRALRRRERRDDPRTVGARAQLRHPRLDALVERPPLEPGADRVLRVLERGPEGRPTSSASHALRTSSSLTRTWGRKRNSTYLRMASCRRSEPAQVRLGHASPELPAALDEGREGRVLVARAAPRPAPRASRLGEHQPLVDRGLERAAPRSSPRTAASARTSESRSGRSSTTADHALDRLDGGRVRASGRCGAGAGGAAVAAAPAANAATSATERGSASAA